MAITNSSGEAKFRRAMNKVSGGSIATQDVLSSALRGMDKDTATMVLSRFEQLGISGPNVHISNIRGELHFKARSIAEAIRR